MAWKKREKRTAHTACFFTDSETDPNFRNPISQISDSIAARHECFKISIDRLHVMAATLGSMSVLGKQLKPLLVPVCQPSNNF